MLESGNEVIGKPDDDHVALGLSLSPLLDPQVQHVVKIDIGQQRRDTPALNRTDLTGYPFAVLQHARIEPFLDQSNHAPVRYPVLQELHQPFMLQRIEEALKVGVEHPLHHLLPHSVGHSVQRLMLVPPRPESVRKSQEVHLVNRVQYLDGGALDDLVLQHRYSQRSFPTVRFLDIHTPNWSCPVGAAREPSG